MTSSILRQMATGCGLSASARRSPTRWMWLGPLRELRELREPLSAGMVVAVQMQHEMGSPPLARVHRAAAAEDEPPQAIRQTT